ncbi:MAG: glycine cleavage system aminomethyltransferase GcvT [Firmicutes bacterium]|nr:glycine cleavage system aminomethyltransferase GcvT [Bacillota bacterium]
MELKTPLYDHHVALGGKMVPFAGYSMPIQYSTGIIKEHMAVREAAGIFDVSHMGEAIFEGPDATANVCRFLSNNVTTLKVGEVRYSPILNHEGGFVDDCIIYRMANDRFMLVINASNHEKDMKWFRDNLFGDVELKDRSEDIGEVAIQGPKSTEILARLVSDEDIPHGFFTFKEKVLLAGVEVLISHTGYTGETGYEIYSRREDIVKVWEALLEAGQDLGLIPAGLGARDTLRLEAGMVLYGQEINEEITPQEVGLGFFVKKNKAGGFIGKEALDNLPRPEKIRVGLKVTGRGIVRDNIKVFAGDKEIGHTTSGTHSPYFGYGIAMARIDRKYSKVGTELEAEVRGRRIPVEVVKLPFYKKAD